MGGCGKTSLLREVHKELQDSKLYKTAFVVVSNPPNYLAIQDSIANWIGLEFEREKNVPDRAARLSMAFEKDKKYLIFLDDVWEVLDFKAIGIPIGENFKVLLSTRQQHRFEEEAWALFQTHAVMVEDTCKDLSLEFTKECQGLPITIVSVARSLKHKAEEVWKEALEELKGKYAPDLDDTMVNPLRCLRLCIEYLLSDELRSLLLLCSLFPEDSNIPLRVLIKLAYGLRIFEDVDSHASARSKVSAAIGSLLDSGLLLAREEGYIHMHDLVCDVALWVARKTHVIRRHKMDPEAFFGGISSQVTRLYCYNICEFLYQFNLPKLEILFVSNSCARSPEFTDKFFDEMRELKVMAIINTFVWADLNLLLPQSIDMLKSLRTLCLDGWILGDMSILGELKMLETIELLSCVIEQLPKRLAKLRKLKSLEVSRCSMVRNPWEVLAACSQLEELYFVGNHLNYGMGSDAYYALHLISSSEVLQRHHLEIGTSRFTLENDLSSKFLSLNDFLFDSLSSKTLHGNVFARKLEVLYLNNMEGCLSSIVPDLIPAEGECANELIELSLSNSDDIICLIDNMHNRLSHDKNVFSKLLKLRLFDMGRLQALCRGQPPSGLFEKLEKLLITGCKRLSSIVSSDMLNLCNLRYLQLRDCGRLKYLFTYSTAQTMISLEVLKVKDCRLLKYMATFEGDDDIFSTTVLFPKLREVSIVGCDMRYMGPASFAGGLSELEILKIKDAPQLEYVFGEYNDGIVQSLKIDLPALKVFKLINLPKITSIAPENCNISCPSLAGVQIRGCPNLISTSGLGLKEIQQSDDEATKHDSGPPTQLSRRLIKPATNMESNSEPEGLPKDYKSPDKQEAKVTMEEERCHDDFAVDKDEKEAGQDKSEKYGIPEDNNRVIEQGAISCVDSRELDKELIEKQPNVEPQLPLVLEDQQQALEEYKAEDSHEVQVGAEVHPQSQKLDGIDETQEGFQEHNPNPVDSVNLRESNTKIAKVSLHRHSALEEPTVRTSSEVLIDRQPQIMKDPQQALQEYKVSLPLPVDPTVLSPSTSITTTSSSTNQHPPSEEFVDFHGLFKIKETRARLLEEAFIKYPHLWEWKLSQKSLRICKVGYKSLTDMLAFLKSETPKTMNVSKMEEFENLYYEVEYFGFDKMWLTSIRQRVMDMQADHNNKLKQLESQISNLEEQLSSVKYDLSKPGHVFGF